MPKLVRTAAEGFCLGAFSAALSHARLYAFISLACTQECSDGDTTLIDLWLNYVVSAFSNLSVNIFWRWPGTLPTMSLRHLRRAELEQQEGFRKELRASKSHNALALHSSEESSVPEREATTARRSVFLQAVSSDAESSQEEADSANEASSTLEKDNSAKDSSPLSSRDEKSDGKKRAKPRNRRKRRAHPAVPPPQDSQETFVESHVEESLCDGQEEAAASSLPQISGNNSETASCLYMERGAFDPDAELRRIFGREVLQRSRIRARGALTLFINRLKSLAVSLHQAQISLCICRRSCG